MNLKQDRVRRFQMKPPQFGMWGGGSQGVIGQKDPTKLIGTRGTIGSSGWGNQKVIGQKDQCIPSTIGSNDFLLS